MYIVCLFVIGVIPGALSTLDCGPSLTICGWNGFPVTIALINSGTVAGCSTALSRQNAVSAFLAEYFLYFKFSYYRILRLAKTIFVITIRPSLIYTVYLFAVYGQLGPIVKAECRICTHTAFCLEITCRYGVLPWLYKQIRLSVTAFLCPPPPTQWLRHGGGQHK